MSSNPIEEEKFLISKSVMTNYVVSAMAFEYVVAQNINKNPKGIEFLEGIEKLAKETVTILGIPLNEDDLKQLNQHFVKKIIQAFETGVLKK